MQAASRRRKIIDMIDSQGMVRVEELSELFGVSEMTIYRDLERLEKEGYLKKTLGGAIKNLSTALETSFMRRLQTNWEEKRRIARKAVEYIGEGDSVALDSSTSTLALAKELRERSNLTVITNFLSTLMELSSNREIQVVSTGGNLRRKTLSLVGPAAEKYISDIHADKAFISAKGIAFEEGLTDSDLNEAEMKKLIVRCAREAYFLADHSKFNQVALYTFARVTDLTRMITDDKTDPEFIRRLEEMGIAVDVV